MLANDSVTDTQTQPGSLPHFLGGKERIENSLGILDALAVVAEKNLGPALAVAGGEVEAGRAPRARRRGVCGVLDIVGSPVVIEFVCDPLPPRIDAPFL